MRITILEGLLREAKLENDRLKMQVVDGELRRLNIQRENQNLANQNNTVLNQYWSLMNYCKTTLYTEIARLRVENQQAQGLISSQTKVIDDLQKLCAMHEAEEEKMRGAGYLPPRPGTPDQLAPSSQLAPSNPLAAPNPLAVSNPLAAPNSLAPSNQLAASNQVEQLDGPNPRLRNDYAHPSGLHPPSFYELDFESSVTSGDTTLDPSLQQQENVLPASAVFHHHFSSPQHPTSAAEDGPPTSLSGNDKSKVDMQGSKRGAKPDGEKKEKKPRKSKKAA